MNTTVLEALAAELATLTRVVDAPTGDVGYGTDLSCTTDLSPTLAEVDPTSPSAIVEAVIRRFITPRGGLADDAGYGLDVRAHANRGATLRDLRALGGSLQGEAQKDDRVSRAQISVSASLTTSVLAISVSITPADPALQAFSFTFAVTDSSVLLETIDA